MSRRKSFESSGCVQIEGEEDGYDALTGLPDRTSLERRIEQRLAQKGRPFSLIVIDIDNFGRSTTRTAMRWATRS